MRMTQGIRQLAPVPGTITKLKLGKGNAFIKSRLRMRLLWEDVWEADYVPALIQSRRWKIHGNHWLGMVISQSEDLILADEILDRPPSVNDMARLLASAMEAPLVVEPHRPGEIHLRTDSHWSALLPHLAELGIEVVLDEKLPRLEKASDDFFAERSLPALMSEERPGLGLSNVDQALPILSTWVRTTGCVEIGAQGGAGFNVKIRDRDRTVLEIEGAQTLEEALRVLEKAIAGISTP
jgi:hypothetical protein